MMCRHRAAAKGPRQVSMSQMACGISVAGRMLCSGCLEGKIYRVQLLRLLETLLGL
jgi:hypothetical protein